MAPKKKKPVPRQVGLPKDLVNRCRRITTEQVRLAAIGYRAALGEGWADQVRSAQDVYALAEGCRFDARFADHAQRFFEAGLVHATGRWAGEPFTLMPWQRDQVVRPLFGWRRPDGSRRFRSAFIYIPKKNGKTSLSAGLMLYSLVAEPDPDHLGRSEPAAEVYAASTSAEVGSILYREARKLATKSPALQTRLRCLDQTRRILYPATSSFVRVLPHKAESAEGMIASAVFLDEVHAMKSRKLYAALRWAGAARRQPLFVEITTAGVDTESLWRDRYRYTKRVIDGEHVDTAHLGVIYEADAGCRIDDPAQHRKSNPSLGETIDPADLMTEAKQALAEGGPAIAEFRRYRLNQAVGAAVAWISPDVWDKGQRPFSLEELTERPCYGGLDLAKVSDFTSLCLLWPPPLDEAERGAWFGAWWFWIPRAAVEQRLIAGDTSYQDWAAAGLIEVTDGDTTDHQVVRARINTLAQRFKIIRLGIDRGFEGWQFTQDLFNDDELPAVGVGQGWRSQDVPMQRIEALVRDARLNAGGNPIMRWQIGNAVAKRVGSNGNYHLDKERAKDKVDGVAALINAMHVAEATPPHDEQPYYTECPLI
jgi:phage terminase large subunit-like protein